MRISPFCIKVLLRVRPKNVADILVAGQVVCEGRVTRYNARSILLSRPGARLFLPRDVESCTRPPSPRETPRPSAESAQSIFTPAQSTFTLAQSTFAAAQSIFTSDQSTFAAAQSIFTSAQDRKSVVKGKR